MCEEMEREKPFLLASMDATECKREILRCHAATCPLLDKEHLHAQVTEAARRALEKFNYSGEWHVTVDDDGYVRVRPGLAS